MRLRALLLAVPLAVAGLAVPAYAEPGLTVTWPTTTEVDVANTAYTFTVADTVAEPQGVLYAEWQGERTEIPHTGDHTMAFTTGGTGTIKVIRCVPPTEPPGDPVCTETGDVSPELTVFKSMNAWIERISFGGGAGDTAKYQLSSPDTPSATVAVTWTLVQDLPTTDVATGQTSVDLDAGGSGTFTVKVPDDVKTGGHRLEVRLSTEFAPFGPHRGYGWDVFDVDGDAPTLSAGTSGTSVYPYRDRYRDSIALSIRSNEYVGARIEVLNGSGKIVRTILRRPAWYEHRLTFDGRTASGAIISAGSYRFRVTVTDPVGFKTTKITRSFAVSHKRLVKKTWKRTLTPAQVHPGPRSQYVGKCSTLRKPSLRGWAGSFGFYSETKCARADESSVVSTVSGVYVPKAFQNRYGTYQVWLNGGGAKSGGKRHGRNAYIVMFYRNTAIKDVHRVQFNGVMGSHAGRSVAAGSFVFDKTAKPYVLWRAGLSEGSRYDVKSYTVKLTYTALQ